MLYPRYLFIIGRKSAVLMPVIKGSTGKGKKEPKNTRCRSVNGSETATATIKHTDPGTCRRQILGFFFIIRTKLSGLPRVWAKRGARMAFAKDIGNPLQGSMKTVILNAAHISSQFFRRYIVRKYFYTRKKQKSQGTGGICPNSPRQPTYAPHAHSPTSHTRPFHMRPQYDEHFWENGRGGGMQLCPR